MPASTKDIPELDPTPIFEHFRGVYGTELLTAAIAHFHVFETLASQSMTLEQLREKIGLELRPANVLITALRAMKLIDCNDEGQLSLSPMAGEHLHSKSAFDVSDYIGLMAESPGVLQMVERLKTNRPAGSEQEEGAAFIYREGIESAMEQEASARHLTLALAGRAKNVAPVLAQRIDLGLAQVILDVGGGTGIYSIALLQQYPQVRAIVQDRPEVLKIAQEMAEAYGVTDRLECLPGDMFTDELPTNADVILLSNVLHDWDVPECQQLIQRCAEVLPQGGRLLIHDVFLDDDLGGPLPLALYSAALFTLTEGRAYSAKEYRQWLTQAGLQPENNVVQTLIHCGVLTAVK